MALVIAQAFYRIYDDSGVALAEVDQNGTVVTTTMQFVNTDQGNADRSLLVNHGLNAVLVKEQSGGVIPVDMFLETHWVELYGYTNGTVHPGHQFRTVDENNIIATLIGVPTRTTYRGTLVVQKLHTIMQ